MLLRQWTVIKKSKPFDPVLLNMADVSCLSLLRLNLVSVEHTLSNFFTFTVYVKQTILMSDIYFCLQNMLLYVVDTINTSVQNVSIRIKSFLNVLGWFRLGLN